MLFCSIYACAPRVVRGYRGVQIHPNTSQTNLNPPPSTPRKRQQMIFLKILISYIALKMTIWTMLTGLRARKRHNSVFQCRTAHAGIGAYAGGQSVCKEGREVFSPLLTCVDAFRPSQQPQIVIPVVTPIAVAQPCYQVKAKSRHQGFFTSSQLQQIQQNCSKVTTRGEGKGNQKAGLGFVS